MDKVITKKDEKDLLERLNSPIEEIVVIALQDSKFLGNAKVVKPILDIVIREDWLAAKSKALEVLSSLKEEESIAEFFKLFNGKKYEDQISHLIAAIWLAGMDARDHIGEIVKASLRGEYIAVVEALTVLDNTEGEIPEQQLLDAQLECKTYLSNNENSDKAEIVKTMLNSLEAIDTFS